MEKIESIEMAVNGSICVLMTYVSCGVSQKSDCSPGNWKCAHVCENVSSCAEQFESRMIEGDLDASISYTFEDSNYYMAFSTKTPFSVVHKGSQNALMLQNGQLIYEANQARFDVMYVCLVDFLLKKFGDKMSSLYIND